MARLIIKAPYLKPIEKSHVEKYIKYIATRDGVEMSENTEKYLPSTKKQQKLIKSLIEDAPDVLNSLEYNDYIKNSNRVNASELINYALENYCVDRKIYVKYISERPGVEKISSHGLFTDEGEYINMSKLGDELINNESNMWTFIISLKREDAERFGYNNAKAWRDLLRSHANDIAYNMHIDSENFKWYAAFHNEEHHPHVHIIAYSTKSNEAYLSKNGIMKIKKSLANDMFRDEIYQNCIEKNIQREKVKSMSSEIVNALVSEINKGIYDNKVIENKLVELSKRLASTSGKKVYGYLKPDVKNIINSIVDELEKDERINQLYDLWYEKKFETIKIYTDNTPKKVPLSQNKDFKSIKNMIIREALDINADTFVSNEGEDHFDDKDEMKIQYKLGKTHYENKEYKQAEECFKNSTLKGNPYASYFLGRIYSTENELKDLNKAVKYFLQSAKAGNSYGYYQLGKIYFYGGEDFESDTSLAMEYLQKASEQGNQYAEQMIYDIQKHKNTIVAGSSLRLLQNLARLIQRRIEDDHKKKQQHGIDRKEQQKINKKKQAHGLKIST